ncbi:rod shape-determining protein MreD [Jeotgalibacillus aurantiacus]|uniref:rod shape-determining protein MreD n=1 Tax=Jeotgalibacillus aurantiacus TaxID=2763266 RepID=UPI001D0ACCB7|nr:rod shape-determining protein MreD [Jeotgalibacillus aurantiacus]
MRRFLLPFLAIVIFYSESIFATFSPVEMFGDTRFLVPRFLFIFLIFLSIYYQRNAGYIYGFVFGFMYDVFFTGVIGVYMFLFPALIYAARFILRYINQNAVVTGLIGLFLMAALEFLVYQFNLLIGVAGIDFQTFLNQRLYSTLLFNALFILIAAYPLKMWMTALRKSQFDD